MTATAAHAIETFSGGLTQSPTNRLAFRIATGSGANIDRFHDFAVDTTFALDDVAQTITFSQYKFSAAPFTMNAVEEFTVGLGSTVSITTTVTISSFATDVTGTVGPIGLSPQLGGIFVLAAGPPTTFGSVTLSGTYSVTGPTQMASGTFSKTFEASFPDFPGASGWRLDSNGFPSSVALQFPGENAIFDFSNTGASGMFSGVVDGAQVNLQFFNFRLHVLGATVPNISSTTTTSITAPPTTSVTVTTTSITTSTTSATSTSTTTTIPSGTGTHLNVRYVVDLQTFRRQAVIGSPLMVQVYGDSGCSDLRQTQFVGVEQLTLIEQLKTVRPAGGARQPRLAMIYATLSDVPVAAEYFVTITGPGAIGRPVSCQLQGGR